MTDGSAPRADRGQTLVLFALVLVGLLAISALAIDVTSVYASLRFYRATADAASLAGAQDLAGPKRTVSSSERIDARTHALDSLVAQLGASGPGTCDPSIDQDLNLCQLGNSPYQVSVKTPAPSCVSGGCSVDANHAVQVTVRQPNFSLTFARIFGINNYSPSVTSVSGTQFPAQYALLTLQPPDIKHNGTDANIDKDLTVNGNGTVLDIVQGDIGTNTSATTTLQGCIKLADTYRLEHVDDLAGLVPGWYPDPCMTTPPSPKYVLGALIKDPGYKYPKFTGCTNLASGCYFPTQADGKVACTDPKWKQYFPTDYTTLLPSATTTCYLPGVYADNQPFGVAQNTSAFLEPGAYYFPSGLSVNGTLAGGLVTGKEGVDLMFDESNTKIFSGTSSQNILLNAGGSTCSDNTCRADPAVDVTGATLATPDGYVLTIEVARDDNCFASADGVTPTLCPSDLSKNRTVNLQGNGILTVAGVIYGPSDNMQINANNTVQTGVVGQIISWTVAYAGGARLSQEYPGTDTPGVMRIDDACTAPGTPCSP